MYAEEEVEEEVMGLRSVGEAVVVGGIPYLTVSQGLVEKRSALLPQEPNLGFWE